jgi:hypothetical protein
VASYPSIEAMEEDARAERAGPGPLRGVRHLKRKIREATDYLAAMREVVPIRTDLDIEGVTGERDDGALQALAQRWNVKGPVGRLRTALDEGRR